MWLYIYIYMWLYIYIYVIIYIYMWFYKYIWYIIHILAYHIRISNASVSSDKLTYSHGFLKVRQVPGQSTIWAGHLTFCNKNLGGTKQAQSRQMATGETAGWMIQSISEQLMQWNAMERNGMQWNAMECNGMQWNAMDPPSLVVVHLGSIR